MMHSYIISGDGDAARSRAREMAAAALCEQRREALPRLPPLPQGVPGRVPRHPSGRGARRARGGQVRQAAARDHRRSDPRARRGRCRAAERGRRQGIHLSRSGHDEHRRAERVPEAARRAAAASCSFSAPKAAKSCSKTVQSRCGEIRLAGGTVAPENERARGYLEARLDRAELLRCCTAMESSITRSFSR